MPLQNRVTPFGEIVAVAERGMFTGNRGIIHDPETRTLLKRRWASRAWLICVCDYKGVRRQVMGRKSWTELFFMDEATALAAGHRPCFECRRTDANAFRSAWSEGGVAGPLPKAGGMDTVLHQERLNGRAKRIHPLDSHVPDLPNGAMVAGPDGAYVVAGGKALRWTPAGYVAEPRVREVLGLLTPPSTLRALRAGYRPVLHPSAN